MAEQPPPPPAAPGRWIRVTLAVSLAINLLIVGMVAGAILSGPRDRAPALRDLGYGPFVAALPPKDRRILGRAAAREAGAFRQNRAEMRAVLREFLTALRAEPYDPDATARIVGQQQAKAFERQSIGQRLLLQRLAEMTAAERADYADALETALRRRARGGERRP